MKMEELEIVVTKINECEDTQVFKKVINTYSIERAVSNMGEELREFKGFTGEMGLIAFKHAGSKTISQKNLTSRVVWEGNVVDVTAYDFENAHATVYFKFINSEDEEIEGKVEFDTEFEY